MGKFFLKTVRLFYHQEPTIWRFAIPLRIHHRYYCEPTFCYYGDCAWQADTYSSVKQKDKEAEAPLS